MAFPHWDQMRAVVCGHLTCTERLPKPSLEEGRAHIWLHVFGAMKRYTAF